MWDGPLDLAVGITNNGNGPERPSVGSEGLYRLDPAIISIFARKLHFVYILTLFHET